MPFAKSHVASRSDEAVVWNLSFFRASLRMVFRASAFALLTVIFFSAPQPAEAQSASAQASTPLQLFKNYIVTGDYVVGGVGLRGLGQPDGFAPGTITIPDPNSVPSTGVPDGAEIVAAYLYWATVESSQSVFAGQNGFFNGYAISGTILGNPNAPVSWSSGGCSGSSNGSKTMRTYRADVRPYLNLDSNGRYVGNASYKVRLADSGSNGGGAPLTFGASLVLVYRVLSPAVPLNSIVFYDGAYAPSNTSSTMTQPMVGIYQAASSPVSKLTHIVGNGQANKSETVYLNNVTLPSLYQNLNQPAFPGFYNGSWDNPTWLPNHYGAAVNSNDSSATTSVVPSATNSGCVSWGTVVLSSTVQDSDGDGLLDTWEDNQGYTDVASNTWVALPGANKTVPDIFVELDYLSNLDGSVGAYPRHSHLPKQAAIDMVGNAFNAHGINVHFDLGAGVYPGDPFVVQYPLAAPPAGSTVFQGAGGKSVSEGAALCNDGATLCAYPGQPAVAWKGGFDYFQYNPTLGNFEPGRAQSYHYMLWGHSLGLPRSYWSSWGATQANNGNILSGLVSIVDTGNTAVVTLQSPPNYLKPGDPVVPGQPGFGDNNLDRVTITGAIGQPGLNGVYRYANVNSNGNTTTFTINTSNVADGTYKFSNEPGLGVAYAGPVSSSGHSDIGGADSAVTFGLWTADDPSGCQPNPATTLQPNQVYCDNMVGNTLAQAGTLMHELGHTLALTHGGTFFNDPQNPSAASYGLNCEPNFLSIMNYLFQIRGFPDGGIDYSGQTLPPLNASALVESVGIGNDVFTNKPAAHYTRWYAPPNAIDTQIQNTTGGRYATHHCDGTALAPNEPPAVRVEGNTFSAPIDWNNDLVVPDGVNPQDVNFNGVIADAPFAGFNDWTNSVNLRQIGARPSGYGFSGGIAFGGGGIAFGGGGIAFGGGGIAFGGGGIDFGGGGIAFGGGGIAFGGGGIAFGGGGTDQDFDTFNSTAPSPSHLTAGVPAGTHTVLLNWSAPSFTQVRKYNVYRATGSFPTAANVAANSSMFSNIGQVSGAPPATKFVDATVKNNTTYTYFITDVNKPGVQSGASDPVTIFVKF
jgi:hypothetical protein